MDINPHKSLPSRVELMINRKRGTNWNVAVMFKKHYDVRYPQTVVIVTIEIFTHSAANLSGQAVVLLFR